MVKKHDESWRTCVDFKDLNKTCPKDGYPLQEIDWKVESQFGFPFKCFLDEYKGYHQIQMAEEDEEKTAFITSQRIFCYTKMPFGLRNAGATYQCLVNKAFHKQIGRNLKVYVDDLVIKSRTEDEIVRNIKETFKTLREINMKLNPKKYTFGIEEGMFLGYKVSTRGLKVCPDKVDAVLSHPSPNRAFKKMKRFIAELPMLVALMEKEELIVYLAAAKETVSAVLMTERETKQMPIYFVSRALRGPKINYTSMEKLVLALVHANKRLKRYFQAHPIIVVTNQPIQQVLSRPEVAGRLQKWSIELGEYAIHYWPRVSVKGHILADFIVKRPEEDSPNTLMAEEEELPVTPPKIRTTQRNAMNSQSIERHATRIDVVRRKSRGGRTGVGLGLKVVGDGCVDGDDVGWVGLAVMMILPLVVTGWLRWGWPSAVMLRGWRRVIGGSGLDGSTDELLSELRWKSPRENFSDVGLAAVGGGRVVGLREGLAENYGEDGEEREEFYMYGV
ncbi:reverse transcriptase domain-containing protein [Tanacetum coccineum]